MRKLLIPSLLFVMLPFCSQANINSSLSNLSEAIKIETENCKKIPEQETDRRIQCVMAGQDKIAKEWFYEERVDEMRNVKSYSALKANSNMLDFTFPMMITGKKENLFIGFGLSKCSPTCKISYKFDNGDVIETEALGHDGMALILGENADKFVNSLISSKNLIIEIPTTSGIKQIKYWVDNFDSEKFIR